MIDSNFEKRNPHYAHNRKKAKNKISGKEKVVSVFDEANICWKLLQVIKTVFADSLCEPESISDMDA